MKYYHVSINLICPVEFQGLRILELVVKAQNRIEACTEAIHAYRLSVPEDLKKLDLEIGEICDVTDIVERFL